MAVLSRVPRSRTVKRLNQRWDRQKSITRGHVDDHAGEAEVPTIVGITPESTTVAGPRTFTITGSGFTLENAPLFMYTAPAQAETSSSCTYNSSTILTVTLPTSAVDTAGTITWHLVFQPSGPDLPGSPNITVA